MHDDCRRYALSVDFGPRGPTGRGRLDSKLLVLMPPPAIPPSFPCAVELFSVAEPTSFNPRAADPDTGLPRGPDSHENWVWDERKAIAELESREPEVLFVCGSCRNPDQFLRYFTKVFNLRVD